LDTIVEVLAEPQITMLMNKYVKSYIYLYTISKAMNLGGIEINSKKNNIRI